MKTINNYLLEKLILNKSIVDNKITIKFPVVDNSECKVLKQEWKELKFPPHRFFIIKDYYRAEYPHLIDFMDMILSMSINEEDFEGFNPDKDILYSSDNFEDILHWYIEDFLSMEWPEKYDSDWIDEVDNKKINDHGDFLINACLGKDKWYEKQDVNFSKIQKDYIDILKSYIGDSE